MPIARTKADLAEALSGPRRDQAHIGFVPTMGALHDGHLSLISAAQAESDLVVVSVFVNPTQFNDPTDLAQYPRSEVEDARMAMSAGADLVFAPAVAEVYPAGDSTSVRVEGLTGVLCGAPKSRGVGHFRGVTTVVAKLLNMVGPDRAYFGQKDAQQAAVITRMVTDLQMPIEIRVLPTVREADGLAMSSRNARLKPAEREQAASLHLALCAVEAAVEADGSLEEAVLAGREILKQAGVEPEYFEARDPESLEPVTTVNGRPVLVAVAADFDSARLIDNVIIMPKERI